MFQILINYMVIVQALFSFGSCTDHRQQKETKEALISAVRNNDSCQILYHGNFSYQLCAPQNMIAQEDSTLIGVGSSRILVQYHPIKSESKIVIYSNIIFKKELHNISTTDFISGEISTAKQRGEKVFLSDSINLSEQKRAIIRNYFNDANHEYFSIAYIDEPKHIVMITYSTRTLKDFQNNNSSFETVIKSYRVLKLTSQ